MVSIGADNWVEMEHAGWRFHMNCSDSICDIGGGHTELTKAAPENRRIRDGLEAQYGKDNVATGNAWPKGADLPTGIPGMFGIYYRLNRL